MLSSHWQKQHIYFGSIVWGISAIISLLLISLMLSLGFGFEVAGVFFLVVFAILRVSLGFLFKNRYGNSLVRTLKFDYEEIERDFRILFKDKHIRFNQNLEEDNYNYEFPGHSLTMTVQPHWIQVEQGSQPVTKVTLYELTAKNKEFAEMLAESIDVMANHRLTTKPTKGLQPT